jgi:hypothetical protein
MRAHPNPAFLRKHYSGYVQSVTKSAFFGVPFVNIVVKTRQERSDERSEEMMRRRKVEGGCCREAQGKEGKDIDEELEKTVVGR